MGPFLRWSASALAVAALAACGPSYNLIADGDSQWDRCYSLDHDDQATNDDRLTCWRTWDQSYSVGQPQERIRQARDRITELTHASAGSSGGSRPSPTMQQGMAANAPPGPQPPPGWGAQQPGAPPQQSADGTVPTVQQGAARTPPTADPTTRPSNASSGGGTQPPGSACESACRDAWTTCATGCNGDAACSARCDDTYRDCMRGCF